MSTPDRPCGDSATRRPSRPDTADHGQPPTDQAGMAEALLLSRRRSEAVLQAALDCIVIIDAGGRVTEWNPAAEATFGWTRAEALGRTLSTLIIPERLRAAHEQGMALFLATGDGPVLNRRIEVPAVRRDGTELPVELTIVPIGHGGEAVFTAFLRDLSAQKAVEGRLRMLAAAVENANDVILITEAEPVGQPGPRVVYVNDAFTRMTGYGREEILGKTPRILQGPGTDLATCAYLREKLVAWEPVEVELLNYRKDGTPFWSQIHIRPVVDENGWYTHWVAVQRDVTARREMQDTRERLLTEALDRADRDPLTGLLNHRAFHKRLEEEADRAQREGGTVAVAIIDLDNFKFFNDAYGHTAGDDVLRQVADALRRSCRSYDALARYGGDEFAVLMPGTHAEDATKLGERLHAALAGGGYRPPGHETAIPIEVCLGMAVYAEEAATRLETLELADARLRRAKTGSGGDGFVERLHAHVARSVEGFSMLDALVTVVDNKDRYTRRHSEDVMTYSLEIARALGLDEDTRHTIGVAALLHDVGKVGVPDRILRKPGGLTHEEFGAVKQHPVMGATMVATVPGLEATLDAVRYHHERWDGQGYPDGLRGEETPLMARLMAVADAFSAMTTDRPYRKGMTHADALALLRDGAGIQWDPACVRAFLSCHTPTEAPGVLSPPAPTRGPNGSGPCR